MTERSVDGAAPSIPGFTFVRPLGAGGFAEVYLFEQAMPRREVAVKVLSTRLRGDATVRAFEAEANLMATVSAHPSIVTVYQADISPDGRPYLVMEYCPRPTLQERTRGGRMSLTDALRVGVQLAGAVETAHRAGILHRDIKPGNVLFTRYDHPALADFGIAGTLTGDASTDVGLSVPWSPPEAFGGAPVDARLDVYALGATVFAMLEGHAPFQLPGAPNGPRDQMQRIRTMVAPALTRPDVPESLRAAVARALEKDPAARQRSAIEFGHDLQRAQDELDMPHTAIDVLEPQEEIAREDDEEARTHVRGVVRIDPAPPVPVGDRAGRGLVLEPEVRSTTPWPTAPPTSDTALIAPPVADTVLRPREVDPAPSEPARDAPAGSGIRRAIVIAAAALVVAGVVLVLLLPHGTSAQGASHDAAQPPADPAGAAAVVPAVTALHGAASGSTVRFTWTDPSPQPGDTYVYSAGAAGAQGSTRPVQAAEVVVRRQPSAPTCVTVSLVRANGRSSDQPATSCVG